MATPRRIPLAEYEARRVVLIKPSALGDILNTLPVLTALRRRFPEAHITWVVNRGYQPLLEGHSDLDATLPFDRAATRGGWFATARTYGRFFRRLRDEQFDLVLDLQGLFRSALMTLATGAVRRVGLSTAREGATWFYTDVVRVADFNAVHAVDRYWLVAEALGAGGRPKEFRVPIPEAARRWAAEVLEPHARPWIVLAAGSRWQTKRWPAEHFASLVGRAQRHYGGSVLFVGGGDETELAQAAGRALPGAWHDLTGQTTLPQLAALLARADVVVANDTGPLHLAAALGRPVVAPYTCTSVRLNGPYGAEEGAVETRVWCQGSYRKRCNRLDCMAELTPDRLWPVLCRVLEAWQSKNVPA
jgi:heptosyltransferase I